MDSSTAQTTQAAKEGVMKAATIAAPGEIQVVESAIPEPGDTQVRVKLEGCGVCASNLEIWSGQPWFTYPMEAGGGGHEGWGVIDKLGTGVTNYSLGDRVAILSGHAYAQFDVADEGSILKLPAELAGHDVPAEPLGCAYNIFKRSRIEPGQIVAIVGVGFLGALVTRLAADAAATVIGIGRRKFALNTAKRYGAAYTIELQDRQSVVDEVFALTNGKGCDVVIEAVGKQEPLDLATQLTCERGRLVIAGYHQDGARTVDMQLWNWRGLDVINAHERDPRAYMSGMASAVELIRRRELDPEPLYTHTFSIDELGAALDMTQLRPEGFMKAIIKYD